MPSGTPPVWERGPIAGGCAGAPASFAPPADMTAAMGRGERAGPVFALAASPVVCAELATPPSFSPGSAAATTAPPIEPRNPAVVFHVFQPPRPR